MQRDVGNKQAWVTRHSSNFGIDGMLPNLVTARLKVNKFIEAKAQKNKPDTFLENKPDTLIEVAEREGFEPSIRY